MYISVELTLTVHIYCYLHTICTLNMATNNEKYTVTFMNIQYIHYICQHIQVYIQHVAV